MEGDAVTDLITRAEWNARPPKNKPGRLAAPSGVTYHWGGPPVGVRTHADCARKVWAWQAFHMDVRGWADIAYNLVVCPHGHVYEGRGVHARSAANGTNAGNSTHYAICYLGGEGEPLTDAGKRGLLAARDYLMVSGNAGSEVRKHNSWKPTGCPGRYLEEWIDAGCPVVDFPPITPPPVLTAATEVDSMKIGYLPSGLTILVADGRIFPLTGGERDALRSLGVQSSPITAAELTALEGLSRLVTTGKR